MKAYKPEAERFKRSKTFLSSFRGISNQGRVDTDEQSYDPVNWAMLPAPATRPEAEEKVLTMAHQFAKMAEALGGAPEDEAVRAMLGIREDLYMNWPGQYIYFYIGPPRRRPLPVMLGVWNMTGERDQQLRALAGAETVDLIEPPVIEEFPTERLGAGVKVWCVQKAPHRRNAVVGLLGYAWRSEYLETDLHMRAMCPDLGWLQGAMPGIDEFARALRIVPKKS